MSNLTRVSFSLEEPLLERLEALVQEGRARNRSEFLRDLIRNRLVEREWEKNEEALGTVTLVFDHQARRLSERLVEVQHDHHDRILATTHVHLDAHLCAEMIMLRGPAAKLCELANRLGREKGVLHATLSMSSTGGDLL